MVRRHLKTFVSLVFLSRAGDTCLNAQSLLVSETAPESIFGLLALLVAGLTIFGMMSRRWANNRRIIRGLNQLGEELLTSQSPAEALKKLQLDLTRILKASSVRLLEFDKNTQTFAGMETPINTDLQANRESPYAGAIFALQNRTLLTIPNSQKSPLLSKQVAAELPVALVYVPMMIANASQPVGILELSFDKSNRKISRDVQICLQHLGNQIAAALRIIHQQSMQEQLVRSEKLATAGQLIAGIADELSTPLNSISQLSASMLRHPTDSLTERSLRAIASHADRAAAIVSRLTGFSGSEGAVSGKVDIADLLRGMIGSKHQFESNLHDLSVTISGNRSQLQQVFETLLAYVELGSQRILIGVSTAPKSVLVRIEFATPASATETPFSLDFCRGIFNAHNGNIKLVRNSENLSTFEIELPLVQATATPVTTKESWTVLLVEPEGAVQRKLLSILSAEGHRVIPVVSAEEASDLLERMRFDVIFCDVRLPGRSWIEFYESVRHRPIAFVLVTEGFDEGLSQVFEGSKGFLLRKPIHEREMAQLLSLIHSGSVQIHGLHQETQQPATIS